MGKDLSFMVKIDISKLIVLKQKNRRRFFNNMPVSPVSCNVIPTTDLKRKVENHSLPYFTFICVLQGTGKILLNQKMRELKPGITVLRFPDEEFSIYRSKDYVEFSIALPAEFGTLIKKYDTSISNIFELELTKQLLAAFEYFFNFVDSIDNDNLLNSASKMFQFITEICCGEKYGKYLPESSFTERACDLLQKSLNSTLQQILKRLASVISSILAFTASIMFPESRACETFLAKCFLTIAITTASTFF